MKVDCQNPECPKAGRCDGECARKMWSEHRVTLGYTIDDDGVYLDCDCGHSENLGFFATPEDAVAAKVKHLADMA